MFDTMSPDGLVSLIVAATIVSSLAKKVSANLQKERFQPAIKQVVATCFIITLVVFAGRLWVQITRPVIPPVTTPTPSPTPSPTPGPTASRGQRQGNSRLGGIAIRVPALSLTPKPTPQAMAQSTAQPTPQPAFEQTVQPTQTPAQQPPPQQLTPQPMSPTAPQTAPVAPCNGKPPIQFPAGKLSN